MNFFGTKRISHLNDERDISKSIVAGLTKIPDQSLIQRFLDRFQRPYVELLTLEIGEKAHQLGQIIGRILNIDTHTKPFYGQAKMKKTKVSSRNRVMKAVITAFVQDQETGNMIYATNNFKKYSISQMLIILVEKVKSITGTFPEHVLFDLGFYNGRVFARLKRLGIKFTTLCKKYPSAKIKIQKVVAENNFTPIKFTTPSRKRMKGKIIDSTTTHVRHYRWKLRLIILKVQGKKELISFLTSDFDSAVIEVIERYARRWRIENWFTEQLTSYSLDNLPSSNYLKNDALDAIRLFTSDVVKLFMNDVGEGYQRVFPKTFYREVLKDLGAYVKLREDTIVVTFDLFDHQYLLEPIFRDIEEKLKEHRVDPRIPWLSNYKLDFGFTKNVL